MASLEAFATQAALAIESARLYAESAEKARTDRDLRVAAEIQRALLPDDVPGCCDLAAVASRAERSEATSTTTSVNDSRSALPR